MFIIFEQADDIPKVENHPKKTAIHKNLFCIIFKIGMFAQGYRRYEYKGLTKKAKDSVFANGPCHILTKIKLH